MFGAPDVSLMYGVLVIILRTHELYVCDNQYHMLIKVVDG